MKKAARFEVWQDISDHFSLLDDNLVYVDAPQEGFLQSLDGKDLYAFRARVLVDDLLWHWTLVPVQSLDKSVEQVFDSALSDPPKTWVSIVEDRRGPNSQLSAAWLSEKFRGA